MSDVIKNIDLIIKLETIKLPTIRPKKGKIGF